MRSLWIRSFICAAVDISVQKLRHICWVRRDGLAGHQKSAKCMRGQQGVGKKYNHKAQSMCVASHFWTLVSKRDTHGTLCGQNRLQEMWETYNQICVAAAPKEFELCLTCILSVQNHTKTTVDTQYTRSRGPGSRISGPYSRHSFCLRASNRLE